MLKQYKDRCLDVGKKAQVYFNLHRGLFSVKQDGIVRGHGSIVKLLNVKFSVNESGRQRVLAEQRKNVHAYVNGTLDVYNGSDLQGYREAYYNPYKTKTFVDRATMTPIHEAKEVLLSGTSIFYK
jgi:hypothetical protein